MQWVTARSSTANCVVFEVSTYDTIGRGHDAPVNIRTFHI